MKILRPLLAAASSNVSELSELLAHFELNPNLAVHVFVRGSREQFANNPEMAGKIAPSQAGVRC